MSKVPWLPVEQVEERMLPYFRMIPFEVEQILAKIFQFGAEVRGHPPGGWENYSWMHHLGRAIIHIGHHLAGTNRDEDNLNHAMWRLCIVATLRRRITAVSEQGDLNAEVPVGRDFPG